MPANIREIKGRIKAVKNIERITKTMQLIASARFQKVQRIATQAHAYADRIQAMVGEVASAIAGSDEAGSQPLISPPSTSPNKTLVLVLTSERGLCGSYNTNVMRLAEQHFATDWPADRRCLEIAGKKGTNYAKFNNLALNEAHTQFGDSPQYEDVAALAERYMDEFAAGKYDAVKVVYMKFLSMSKQVPDVLTLLPLEPPKADASEKTAATSGASGGANYEFSPEPAQLLGELLPVTVKVTLMRCFNDALVSEQLARMVAMKAATDAAGKQSKALKRQFNRARQTAITTELSEIIAGAAALE